MTKEAEEFYNKYIKNEEHIIGGSLAIKQQISSFRDTEDMDIMVDKEVFKIILAKVKNIKKSKYAHNGIHNIILQLFSLL